MKPATPVRSLLLTALLAATASLSAPAFAQINVTISLAPPAPQQEAVPVIQPGYVWAPGYWGWTGERHVWVRGRPIIQRTGYLWTPDRWEERGGHYYRHEGHWEHDAKYKPVKYKKEKKDKHDKDHDEGHDKNHGKGHKGGKHGD